jgi:hypothetical protein
MAARPFDMELSLFPAPRDLCVHLIYFPARSLGDNVLAFRRLPALHRRAQVIDGSLLDCRNGNGNYDAVMGVDRPSVITKPVDPADFVER